MTAVKERPETLEGFTTKMTTGYGNLYVTVTEYENRPFEVFATIGKSGRSTTAKTEAIGRLVSLAGFRKEQHTERLPLVLCRVGNFFRLRIEILIDGQFRFPGKHTAVTTKGIGQHNLP